jgi:hypothetical protein
MNGKWSPCLLVDNLMYCCSLMLAVAKDAGWNESGVDDVGVQDELKVNVMMDVRESRDGSVVDNALVNGL